MKKLFALIPLLLLIPVSSIAERDMGLFGKNYLAFQGVNSQDEMGKDTMDKFLRFQTSVVYPMITYGDHIKFDVFSEMEGTIGLFEESQPVRNIDYAPGASLHWNPNETLTELRTGWLHGSNGESGDSSRSWDRGTLTATLEGDMGRFHIIAKPSIWYAFQVSNGNPDIATTEQFGLLVDDLGGSLVLSVSYSEPDGPPTIILTGEVMNHMGEISAMWNFNPNWRDYFFYASARGGIGDILKEIDEYSQSFNVGLSFMP